MRGEGRGRVYGRKDEGTGQRLANSGSCPCLSVSLFPGRHPSKLDPYNLQIQWALATAESGSHGLHRHLDGRIGTGCWAPDPLYIERHVPMWTP